MKKLNSEEMLVLLNKHSKRIRSAIVKVLRPEYGVLDELMQNIYLRILEGQLYIHKSDSMFIQWAIQTIKRDYYSQKKIEGRYMYVEDEAYLEDLSVEVEKHAPTHKSFIVGANADSSLIYHEIMAEALEALPAEQQHVLKEYESGKTLTQIAKELGISKFTAQSRYRYAKQKLREHFNKGIVTTG